MTLPCSVWDGAGSRARVRVQRAGDGGALQARAPRARRRPRLPDLHRFLLPDPSFGSANPDDCTGA
eukprot:3174085-Rhodomonas_salina.3